MNKLQRRAARSRTASTFHRRAASHGLIRAQHAVSATLLRHDVPVRRALPLRAQWFRNTTTGAVECRWVAETRTEPPMHRATLPFHTVARMPRRVGRADMRPPSR
jgi:hypothetical protein